MTFDKKGFELLHGLVSSETVKLINDEVETLAGVDKVGGVRNVEKKLSSVNALISSDVLMSAINKYLTGEPHLVRAILFNKTIDTNWSVRWHQDKTIAVSNKFESNGWGPWSIKEGIHHVQVPIEVLNQMVTFRLHLDDTTQSNGCLNVIPESHNAGIMNAEQLHRYIDEHRYQPCELKKGGMLVMKPHLLHSSRKVKSSSQRRVLHLEYCNYQLPNGVSWA